jgi:ferredoxin, 2Fe-2S
MRPTRFGSASDELVSEENTMPLIRFMLGENVQLVEATSGQSLMEAARAHNVPGVPGECGGCLSCGSCHVYVADGWSERLEEPGPMESQMLPELTDTRPNSRLGCQLIVSDALDGLVVSVPATRR